MLLDRPRSGNHLRRIVDRLFLIRRIVRLQTPFTAKIQEFRELVVMTGRAHTLLYRPAGIEPGTVGEYIDDIEPGSVLALDNGGREDATVWGDILTLVAHRRGIAGTVIDGACRMWTCA
jgi:regulator of RNase E activity RraA